MAKQLSRRFMTRVHKRSGYRCFYTGLKCAKRKGPLAATVEHLLAQHHVDLGVDQLNNLNVVTAHRFINGCVGNAPLKVKFALKAYLADIIPIPGMNNKKIKKLYTQLTVDFLKSFKPDGKGWHYPWQWFEQEDPRRKRVLKERWMHLLTDEEKVLYRCAL